MSTGAVVTKARRQMEFVECDNYPVCAELASDDRRMGRGGPLTFASHDCCEESERRIETTREAGDAGSSADADAP